ncbi:MAG: ferric iron reductase [Streptosporangiales bacterium]|nr:ferric iron reductase [Streptosporangiales bacterium]
MDADALHDLGGYFALPVRDAPPDDGGWRTTESLYAGSALGGLLDVTQERLATHERRVAASILHQGYAARLWSAALGRTLTGGDVPPLDPETLWWRTTELSLVELLLVTPAPSVSAERPATERPAAELIASAVLDRHLDPLASALRTSTGVSATILTGNVASALMGTLRVLAETPLNAAARALGGPLLDWPPLRGAGDADLTASPPTYRRHSCCLFYRVPGGGLCGDCVLA